ncbi:MAG: endo alpha-1,4 polygalactosaminidase [Microthrixaceae bacterium]|nr:endo alpha-1,4 polygalactosaminidase [Microthrixaceae bacterium]
MFLLALGVALAPVACTGGDGGGSRETSDTASAPHDERLTHVQTFALALGDPLDENAADRLAPFDLVVIDGEGATPGLVESLQADGGVVLGYLSVGTVEEERGWTAAADPYRLDHWEDWDEDYADVADPGFRSLMVDRVAPELLRSGIDGLFLDNTDMVVDHPAQAEAMVDLVAELADLVHGRGGLVFTQNGDPVIDSLVEYLDGWNREDVSFTYDFDSGTYIPVPASDTAAAGAKLRSLANEGLLVTATDYVADGDTDATRRAVAAACEADAVPYVADIALTRLPDEPYRC